MTIVDERIKLALSSQQPFTYRHIIYAPVKTMSEALTQALELVPVEYKDDFRQFYTLKDHQPRKEFVELYLYSLGDEDIREALRILNEAQSSIVKACIDIKMNVEKMRTPM